jgi:hypothetical protein
MNRSMALGTVLILAIGVIAAHSVTASAKRHVPPHVTKPMSPLEMMRQELSQADQPVDFAF